VPWRTRSLSPAPFSTCPRRARHRRELGLETKIPAGVIDAALAELVSAGRVVEVERGRFASNTP
jgi:hypothetical protein